MPTDREKLADRMLFAIDALERLEETEKPTPEQITEFWDALRNFTPAYIGGMTCMNIDAHGNVNMTFLKNKQ